MILRGPPPESAPPRQNARCAAQGWILTPPPPFAPLSTHATLLLADGEHVKVVAERLGHSTTRLTMDTYAHVLKGMQQGAADRLDAMFGGAGAVGLDLDTGERFGVK